MASNYKGLYGIFYKISMEVVKSEILNNNGLPYSTHVLFTPVVVILSDVFEFRFFFHKERSFFLADIPSGSHMSSGGMDP